MFLRNIKYGNWYYVRTLCITQGIPRGNSSTMKYNLLLLIAAIISWYTNKYYILQLPTYKDFVQLQPYVNIFLLYIATAFIFWKTKRHTMLLGLLHFCWTLLFCRCAFYRDKTIKLFDAIFSVVKCSKEMNCLLHKLSNYYIQTTSVNITENV